MISPYVRRLRLGMELRALRAEHNMNQDRVARLIGKSRMDISRLESGQSADQGSVLDILEALGVEGEQWTTIAAIASEASQQGWWDTVRHIGDRQALYANLESGAVTIRAYELTFLPGLLQLPDYVTANADALGTIESLAPATVDGMLAGRSGRQRNLRRPGGPSVEMIVDENAIYRLTAPPAVMQQQLRHLVDVINGGQRGVTLRVLPTRARIADFVVPRCTFSIYSYPDPGDPQVVAIDTVTSDVILTDAAQVSPYEKLYDRLRDAALPPAESADFLAKAACDLPAD
jgi:transcriptional regulator with XRE-family HTH domain